jgi:FKBP-type peptidyl-prolyl cis-trans isomerase FkpA
MSVSTLYHPPHHKAALTKFWIAILVLVAIGVGLAWIGAGSLRPEVTASGLQFRVLQEGKGEPITSVDAALLDYVGTLEDGTVFDNSESHGGAQPFTMGQVFPGFAEAMAKMREGGRYHFTMPKSLAFNGPAPAGFTGDTLTFDVQVRKVVRNGAAMMQAAQGAQQEPTDRGPPERGPPEQVPQQP